MPLYLALDAGGTKTRCLLADNDRVLARASTGTVKLMRVSEAEATARLTAVLGEVAAAAGVPLANINRTCFGLAGLSSPAVRGWAARTIGRLVGGSLILCGDEEIALDAAFAGGPGIIIVAGTGSNAIGRCANGSLHRAGGWGPVLGDEGSGYWIGLEAIRAALRAKDQGQDQGTARAQDQTGSTGFPGNILLTEIQAHWNLTSLGDLVALGNLRAPSDTSTPLDFAGLAPVVVRCAAKGDALAARILHRAGEELAGLIALVAHKMSGEGSPGARSEVIPVAFTGSILAFIAPVRDTMISRLADALPAAQVRAEAVDPLDGALWRARRI